MTMFEDRRRMLEDKYILDFERSFKTRRRRDRMLGEWAAASMRKQDVKAYADEVVAIGSRSPLDETLVHKIVSDFRQASQAVDEDLIREKMHQLMYEAAEALEQEKAAS
ncbi:ATPase inhibitor subunit zeta [Rhizobium sp. BK376]|uniref:ATPase inhibitor subunit zeta n=1 Tax=Rhizobium sp. BK376 TaxID=2512149 RepID=UPI001050FAF1|nr:ATPase inhibitor subunit zeta [Rhizobium sp. BK376]TCR75606.1 hypothetical protein EV561_12245 [Rhizobium sp. BK376]